MLSTPSRMRRPPTPSTAMVLSRENSGGKMFAIVVITLSRWRASRAFAWMPAQRAKKSPSVPRGLQGLDHLDTVRRGAVDLALFLDKAAIGVLSSARGNLQHH